MDEFYRHTWAEIELDAIEDNVKSIRNYLPASVSIMAVVKADGYGHGSFETAQTALNAGAGALAVATLDEAVSLRKKGITDAPILVLGYCPPEYAHIAAEQSVSVTVYHAEWFSSIKINQNQKLKIHVKTDTGMGRVGVQSKEEFLNIVTIIQNSPQLELEGVFTHYANADSLDSSFYKEQTRRFLHFLEMLNVKPKWIHASNSGASMQYPESYFNLIRSGIIIYGLSPSEEVKSHLPIRLRPALSLHTKLIHVKKVSKGSPISYGCTYTAEEEEWIGTIPIGYADGWIRKLQGQTVLINGIRVPIVGRICMDQCMVRLPKYMPIGTKVTLIGKQNNEEITADEIAEKLETINYEIVCMISRRVPRIYKYEGQIVNVANPLT